MEHTGSPPPNCSPRGAGVSLFGVALLPVLALSLALGLAGCGSSSSGSSGPPVQGVAAPGLPEARDFIVDRTTGELFIFDAHRLDASGLTGPVALSGQVGGLALDPFRNQLWITYSDLNVVAVHDASTLVQQMVLTTGTNPTAVAIDATDGRVFVANTGADSVSVFGADPPYAQLVTPITVGATPRDLVVEDSMVVVANRDGASLSVFSAEPPFTNAVGSPFAVDPGPVDLEVDPSDNLVFVACQDGNSISVFDVAGLAVTTPITGLGTPVQITRNPRRDLIFVANRTSQLLHVYSSVAVPVENTDSPVNLGASLEGVASNAFLDRVLVSASGTERVRVLSAEAPFSALDGGAGASFGGAVGRHHALEPVAYQTLLSPQGGSVLDSAQHEGRLFLSHGTTGLEILTLNTPRESYADRRLGGVTVPGSAESAVFRDEWAFISNGGSGIQVADTTNPASAPVVRTVNGIGTTDEIWTFGQYLLVDTGGGGLRVLDAQIPLFTDAVSSVNPGGGSGFDFDLDARLAYSASGTNVAVLNVEDPLFPSSVETIPIPVAASDVVAFDDRTIAVAAGVAGLRMVRVNPLSGSQVAGVIGLGVTASRVQRSRDLALVLDSSSDLHVVAANDPDNPSFVGFLDLPGTARQARTFGRDLYLAMEATGLVIYRFYP